MCSCLPPLVCHTSFFVLLCIVIIANTTPPCRRVGSSMARRSLSSFATYCVLNFFLSLVFWSQQAGCRARREAPHELPYRHSSVIFNNLVFDFDFAFALFFFLSVNCRQILHWHISISNSMSSLFSIFFSSCMQGLPASFLFFHRYFIYRVLPTPS